MKTVEFLGKTYVVEGTVGAPDAAIFLYQLPSSTLVELRNLLTSNLDLGRRIKMFQSKAKGIKLVIDLLIKFDSAFDDDPDDDLPEPMQPFTEPPVGLVAPAAPVVPVEASGPTTAPSETPVVPEGPGPCPAPTPAPDKAAKVRAGSKQAALIDLIKRPEGASIKEISEALGWINHTARGAISRDLKKRLGLPVTKARVDGRGWVYSITS